MFVGPAKEKDFPRIHNINSSAMNLLKKESDDRASKSIIRYFLTSFGQMGEQIPHCMSRSKKMDLTVIQNRTSNINTASARPGCFTVRSIEDERGRLSFGKKHEGVLIQPNTINTFYLVFRPWWRPILNWRTRKTTPLLIVLD